MIHNLLSLALLTAPEVRTEVYPAPARLDAIEYDVIVPPGADPAQISLRFDGEAVLDNGNLLVTRRDGSLLRHSAPVSYQMRDGERTFVASRFRLRADGAVGFEVAGYDRTRDLVIDPVVTASRYFPNPIPSGAFTVDRNTGNAYIAVIGLAAIHKVSPLGVLLASGAPFPGSGPFDRATTDLAGNLFIASKRDCPSGVPVIGSVPGGDILVGKLNSDLTTFSYSLCVRPGPFNTIESIVTDGSGALYVAGVTLSDTFPATGNFGALISGKSHLYVFKVNPAGTNLAYSIVTGNDISNVFLALDNNGNAYVAGMTGPQFEPRQAFRAQFEGGAFDAFLLKILANGSNIPFATFLGGTNATGVAVTPDGNPVVGVKAETLPVVGPFSVASIAPPGNVFGADIWVGKFSADGQQVLLGTFVPGTWSSGTIGRLTARDSDVYITGRIINSQPAGLTEINPIGVPPSPTDAFVVKLDSQFRRVLATRFGGSDGEDFPEIAASKKGFVVIGRTQSTDLPARVNSYGGVETGYAGFVSETADLGIQLLRKTNQHRVTITNFGQENATSVRLTGRFTNNPITATSVPCSTINIGAANNLDCEVGTMFKNEVKTIIVTTANPVNGTFSVSSSLNDLNGGNNQQ